MSEAEIGNFEKELKHYDINLSDIEDTGKLFENIQEAIDTMREHNYQGELEVILNNNLVITKNRIGKIDTIFGCKVSFEDLEECVSLIVKPYEEKTADQMFEELGYEKREHGTDIWYWKDDYGICFAKAGEQAYKNNPFTMQELKAINKKCEELGWL